MKPLLDTKAASPFAGAATGTMENWRTQGLGPRFIKIGRKVFYDPDDIEDWRRSKSFQSTSEVKTA